MKAVYVVYRRFSGVVEFVAPASFHRTFAGAERRRSELLAEWDADATRLRTQKLLEVSVHHYVEAEVLED